MESEGVDTGDIGSVREQVLVHYRTRKYDLALREMTVMVSAILQPYVKKESNALKTSIDSLLDYVSGTVTEDEETKKTDEIVGLLDYMDKITIARDKNNGNAR